MPRGWKSNEPADGSRSPTRSSGRPADRSGPGRTRRGSFSRRGSASGASGSVTPETTPPDCDSAVCLSRSASRTRRAGSSNRSTVPRTWFHGDRPTACWRPWTRPPGALTSAQIRWERTLADDIDDPEARGRLDALRPDDTHWPSDLPFATLVSPEGLRTSRFRLVRELGRGATAAVYLVHDERLRLPLALKVLHPQLAAAARAGARTRFFAEARLAARLRHPGVVAIYDVDESARCLAMEFIAGGTLRDRLRAGTIPRVQRTRTPTRAPGTGDTIATEIGADEALGTARSLLQALAYVHRAGIVHGDLKPGNVLLRKPGEVVLADFGVAEFANAQDPAADRPAGTPLYLAPEQFSGSPPSTRTDLFAAGAILWEFLCGRPARLETSLLMGDHNPTRSIPVNRLAPLGQGGARLGAVITSLLATDPIARPATADVALRALE